MGLGNGRAKRRRSLSPDEDDLDYVEHQVAQTTSTGSVNATFRIPGRTTIPSDDDEHSVTIADLRLDAKLAWVCIPKADTRVHLEVRQNVKYCLNFLSLSFNRPTSRILQATLSSPALATYTSIEASSHDQISQMSVHKRCSTVLSGGFFYYSLSWNLLTRLNHRIDPSIRVTYHPMIKMSSESGYYNKSHTQSFSQRISIQNTKTIAIEGLKITDHIPVSQDANVTVNLISPALTLPTKSTLKLTGKGTPPRVQVSEGIIAQWNGSDDPNGDLSALGGNGKIDWLCAIPAFGTVNLLLQWEVTTTQKSAIYGL